MTTLGVIFPPDRPPEELRAVAEAADGAGLEQLWLWEDCFAESGIAAAAAVLGWTDRLAVGIGLLPVPLRNVALTAMEIATLERLFPGRVMPGVGHGVLEWMAQVGVRAQSPMTLLHEYTEALRALLAGETVTTSGRYVHLDGVTLAWPPVPPPPLFVGAVRERTVQLAGALGDGVILTGDADPEAVRAAVVQQAAGRARAGRDGAGDVVSFVAVQGGAGAASIAAAAREYVAAGATHVALLCVGDDVGPLADFAVLVAREVRPAVSA